MSHLPESAYPRLKGEPSPKELAELYTPNSEELALASQHVRASTARLAFLIHLKVFQRLGYFVRLTAVPVAIQQHVAQASGLQRLPPRKQLLAYDDSGAQRRHMKALREHLKVRTLDEQGRVWLSEVAEQAAETKHTVEDIINVMLEELVRARYELPGFTTLERGAMAAREQVNAGYCRAIANALSERSKKRIDDLLKTADDAQVSAWHTLKREPRKPTNKEVSQYLAHLQQLQLLAAELPKVTMPAAKYKYFRTLARALDAAEMAELRPERRYALAVIFIRSQYSKTLDDVADLFLRLVGNLENHAQQQLNQYQLEHAQRTDLLVGELRQVLLAMQQKGGITRRLKAIEGALTQDVDTLLAECEEHLAYAGKNYLPFLLKPYRPVRALLFNCLNLVSLKSTSTDRGTERLLAALKILRPQRQEVVSLQSLDLTEKDLGWLPEKWRRLVIGKGDEDIPKGHVRRRYFELAVLLHVKDELKSGDLCIEHSERYDDYREQLVDWDTYEQEVAQYGAEAGIATHAGELCDGLKSWLIQTAREVDASFPENTYAEIQNGRLFLRRTPRNIQAEGLQDLDDELNERLPTTSIVDVLVDTEKWLNLHRHFGPLSGNARKLDNPRARFVTTLFCYGCNLGPTQTARSVKGFSRKQIAWLNLKQISEEQLDQAIVKVINAYNKFELPRYWGSGKHAAADGTQWNLYEQNLMAEHHIRYGGYGGIGYYHVSDKYIALYSRFIPCGVYEGNYILDGLLENTSDIQPDTVHGDTQAQSFPVFGLAHLLGINLMPRIRGIKDLIFFRADRRTAYQHIDALFSEPINWKLIQTHLPDMLRVAISIKLGKITASTILRRLGSGSRKNKLYFAFRELGKVVRTGFLLRYIGDVELRQTIQAATNKSEEFNGFIKWAFFGGQGIIAENIRHEQRKVIKYNHLVANMLILHNVERMTRAMKDMQAEGWALTPELLAGLAPYRIGHINRFGDYTLDLDKEIEPLDFNIRIFS
jgi:TnpA family transposase